jgi:hypothetical protein
MVFERDTMASFPIRHSSHTMSLFAALPAATTIALVAGGLAMGNVLFTLVAIAPAIVAVLLFSVARSINHIVVDASTVGITMHKKSIPRSSIKRDQVRIVNLSKSPEYRPVRRTNGVASAELRYGWFVLENGEKALVAVVKPEAVYIPTGEGFSLLVSPDDPKAFVEALGA